MKREVSEEIFEKILKYKISRNPSIGRHFVQCGWIDMTKLIVAFHNSRTRRKTSPEYPVMEI